MLYTATIRRHFNCSYYPGRRAAVAAPYCSLPSLRSVHSRKSTRYLNCPQLSHDNHRLSHTHKKNLSFFFYCGAQGRISFIALVFWPFLIDTPSDDRLASRNLFSFFSHPISPLHKSIRRRFFVFVFLCVCELSADGRERNQLPGGFDSEIRKKPITWHHLYIISSSSFVFALWLNTAPHWERNFFSPTSFPSISRLLRPSPLL